MQTQQAKEAYGNAVRAQQELAKVKSIEGLDQLKEAKECRKEVMAFRALCITKEHKEAVKVADRTIARLTKMIAAYQAVRS